MKKQYNIAAPTNLLDFVDVVSLPDFNGTHQNIYGNAKDNEIYLV